MRLRRVALSGFKTFARRSEVVLEPGITAVVGPNGSGKSNLVDAIRWALGETNARELRGARMDEVIYAGGQGRAPMGVAQVDIVIDNEEGRLPVDDVEVSIARRVTRNGDSEYRLNGGRVRLRDLERLLSSTGLTQNGYAVVAQNDVDGIIEATPAQRRTLVEEAAGVRGLRAAREDALQRVGVAEERLQRLTDQLLDAEPRLAELAEQAEAALEHRAMAARLAELRGSLAREAWRAARAQARRARHRLSAALSRAEAAAEAERGFGRRLEAERARLLEARATRQEAAERLEAARVEAERAAGDGLRWAEHATNGTLQRAGARLEETLAGAEAEAQGRLVEELTRSGEAAEAALRGLADRLVALRTGHDDQERAVAAAERRLADLEDGVEAAERDHTAAEAAVRDHAARAALLEEAAAALAAESTAARRRAAELAAEADAGEARAASLAEAASIAAGRVEAARTAAAGARGVLADAERSEQQAHAAGREAASRAAALRGQVDGALGGGRLAEAVAAGRVAAVRLIDVIQVLDPADRGAVEAALEHHLGAWLAEDLDAAAALLEDDGVREGILAAGLPEPARPAPPPGVRAVLDCVEAPPAAHGAVAHCLSGVWLAPDLPTARTAVASAGGAAVLADGRLVTVAGVRGGGRPGATLALAAQEREAARLAAGAAAAEAEAAARSAAALAARDGADAEVAAALSALESARAEAAEAAAVAAASGAAARAERERAATLDAEREARDAAGARARIGADQAAAAERQAAERVAAARELAAEQREVVASVRDAVAAALAALRSHEIEVARTEPEARDIQRRLAAARQGGQSAVQRVHVAELRLLAAEDAALVALARGDAAMARAQAAAAAVDRAGDQVLAAAGPVEAAEVAVAALENERAEVAVAAARAADERDAAEADVVATEAQVAELAEAVREDDLDEGPEPDAAAAEKAEREIARLERRIGALGPVNGLAPEQHAALASRVEGLRADHDDLATACGHIRELAEQLSGEIERRFDAVFGAVAYHFRMLYEELFPGGRATLRLQQPPPPRDDDDEALDGLPRRPPAPPGVEVLAQPAGKRLQALSLLSGGERALTALAMILALQQVNPSPFYVFDEVDAPLDDANVGRFTRLLRRLAITQQFLVVTHNHATMAAADALYGVTMEGDGTSRLLSVRLGGDGPVPHDSPGAAVSGRPVSPRPVAAAL